MIIEGLLRLKARVPHLHVGGNQQVVFLNHTILFRVVGDSDFNIFYGICTHPITQSVLIGIPMEQVPSPLITVTIHRTNHTRFQTSLNHNKL